MRFMMFMFPNPKAYEGGAMPDPKDIDAMTKYNEQLVKAGVLLSGEGLHSPATGARVTFPGKKAKLTDGPFAEAREVIGGYWMIQVKSRDEAMQWASRIPGNEGDMVKLRQVFEISDFPPSDAVDRAKALMEKSAKQKA